MAVKAIGLTRPIVIIDDEDTFLFLRALTQNTLKEDETPYEALQRAKIFKACNEALTLHKEIDNVDLDD